jgi:hypothetical protein
MLHGLGSGEQPGIKGRRILVFFTEPSPSLIIPSNCVAFLAFWLFLYQRENLIKALDVGLGFSFMFFEGRAKFLVRGRFRHFRQGGQDFLFGVACTGTPIIRWPKLWPPLQRC